MVLENVELSLVILQSKEMKSSESMKSSYIPQNDKFGTDSGSAPSNCTVWAMSKFCSPRRDKEQIKMMGIIIFFFSSETKGTKGPEMISLHLLSVIGTHPLNIKNGNKLSLALFQ